LNDSNMKESSADKKDKTKKVVKKKITDKVEKNEKKIEDEEEKKSIKSVLKKKVRTVSQNEEDKIKNDNNSEITKNNVESSKINTKRLNTSKISAIENIEDNNIEENLNTLEDEFYNDTLETIVFDKSTANYCKIVSLDEAFRVRSQWTNNIIKSSLIDKREKLVDQLKIIDARIEEIKNNRNKIEREVKKDYNSIIEKLKNQEGGKVAILIHDMNEIQKDIDRIDYIATTTGELMNNNRVHEFLLNFKDFHQTIEYAVTKPFKDIVDIKADDFVNEIEERTIKLSDYEKLQKELSLKDEIIYKLIEENNKNVSKTFEEVKLSTENEINEWMQLCDNYKYELNQNLKLREGVKDYIDLLIEKYKLNERDYNLNKSTYYNKSFKMDVRDVTNTLSNLLNLTKVSSELYDKHNLNNEYINKILKRIKLYYNDDRLGDKLSFADYDDVGYLHKDITIKLLSKEFKDITIEDDLDKIVEHFSDIKGFDYKLFIHKFNQILIDENIKFEYDEIDTGRYDILLREMSKDKVKLNKSKDKSYNEDKVDNTNYNTNSLYYKENDDEKEKRMKKKREIIKLSAYKYRNNISNKDD